MVNVHVLIRLDDAEMNRAIWLFQGGLSQRLVSRRLGVFQSVTGRTWQHYQTYGNVTHRHGGGRNRATIHAKDRFIIIQASRKRFQNATA